MENPDFFDKYKAAELLAKDDTFAFVLISIVLNRYINDEEEFPEEYIEEPATLFNDIESDFRIKLPQENEDKINAALTVLTTDLFYTNKDVFNRVAQTFSTGDPGSLEEDNELDACKCMWAIVETGLISGVPLDKASEHMSKAVIEYVNDIVDNEAEDKEEQLESFEAEELDTMEEALSENYYQKFLTCNLLEPAQQLLKLGVPTASVGDLLGEFGRSLDSIEDAQK